MTAIHFDSNVPDDERRSQLYGGDIFVYSPSTACIEFSDFARSLVTEAFGKLDPEQAQHHLGVAEYVRILRDLKPRFIHHPESKKYIREILAEVGCDLHDTYFDVPRLRSSTSHGYLTSGLAFAWHPHRDTWYSAPASQINFWFPVYPLTSSNTIAFHPMYFAKAVANDSEKYNYFEWNKKHRGSAVRMVGEDTRPLPGPKEEIERDSEIRVVCPVGGLIMFSGAHLHSSVPNSSGLTRFSIDFRTVNKTDIVQSRGAPTQDVKCSGSSIRDFVRAADCAALDDSVVRLFDDGTEDDGDLEYAG